MQMRRRTTSLFAGLALISMTGLAAAGPFGKPEAPSLVAPVWSLTGECYPIDFNGIDIQMVCRPAASISSPSPARSPP